MAVGGEGQQNNSNQPGRKRPKPILVAFAPVGRVGVQGMSRAAVVRAV